MRLFVRSLITFLFLILFCFLFVPSSLAATTPFRSANIVTTDGTVAYTNLNNCSVTDGQTCNRALAASYANLYFKDFGNYGNFGMPDGSIITKARIRVTGKSSLTYYVGLSLQTPATSNCQSPSDLLTGYLGDSAINVQNFVVDVTELGIHAIGAYCLQPYNFKNNMTWRINYSSSLAWSANIDNFEIAFDYVPGPTPTPTPISTPTPTPSPTPTPKTPLILIPGIGGSELKVAEDTYWLNKDDGHGGKFNYIYPKDEAVWLNEDKAKALGDDDYFDVLRMKTDGINSEANISLTDNLVPEAYQSMIDFFTGIGYILNQNLFVFPYDWRRDVSLTAPLLDQKINSIKQQTGSTKIDIIAHSMGGLVARNYIVDAGRASNVRKLFTLGTPYLGAVDFLKNLKYGGCLTKSGILTQLANNNICFGLVPSEVKDVIQNTISGYELSPSQSYFNFYSGQDNNHPYPYKTESGVLNYAQIKNLLTGLNYNTPLFTPAESFHNLDNSLSNTNSVDVTVIAGSGRSTLGQIIEQKRTSLLGISYIHKDIFNINGDKTVPLFSASLIDPSSNKSLLGNAKVFYTNQEHGDLVASGSALNLVKNILSGNSQLPDGVSTKAYSLSNGWLFSKHSPVNMNIYDSLGNHTGPTSDGNFETNIPGSSYDTLDDAGFIFIPDDGQYDIKFEATDQGSFDFKIRKYDQDTISQETLYKDIPLTISTKAETQFDTSSSTGPTILLDENGDGTVDQNINPTSNLTGDAVYDQIPPQTTVKLSGIQGNNNWYKSDVTVALTAHDEASGSGINKIEYSLDNGQTIQVYANPFNIPQEGITKIKFRSIDNAGNEEDPGEAEIKIDKTPPQVTVDTNPKSLWPANNKMFDVKITGTSSDANLLITRITVSDEYHQIEPAIANFGQTIQLQASRNGDDMDGRKYTIKAIAEDLAGNTANTLVEVIVPHDQRR